MWLHKHNNLLMSKLTNDLNEVCQDHAISEILPEVMDRVHSRFLSQLRIHPGHIRCHLWLKQMSSWEGIDYRDQQYNNYLLQINKRK